jgi:DNA repair photolyase
MAPNKRSEKPIKFKEGGIMFPTTHDLPFKHSDWWMPFLKGLLEKGNDVLIVSKPELASIKLICDTFEDYKDKIEFRFTIGTHDDENRKYWEPGAPRMYERITALIYAYESGYKTSVSMEPLLDKRPEILIRYIEKFVTETIWIGTMNHMSIADFQNGREMCWFEEMKRINSRENMQRIYDLLKDNPKIRWKDSVRDLLGLP